MMPIWHHAFDLCNDWLKEVSQGRGAFTALMHFKEIYAAYQNIYQL